MHRRGSEDIEHRAEVPTDRTAALDVVLHTAERDGGESEADAALGSAIHAHAVLRKPTHGDCAGTAGLDGQSQTDSATHAADGHRIYPYLLRGLAITRPNQVWSTDITYIRLRSGFVYLVAILDWFSRYVVEWEISTTLDTSFCLSTLDRALAKAKPEIFNSDQGAQFTSDEFTSRLESAGVLISMDGRGRALDNIFTERLWRTVKYEEVYLKDYAGVRDAIGNLKSYFRFYNFDRPHQSLDDQTPASVYFGIPTKTVKHQKPAMLRLDSAADRRL